MSFAAQSVSHITQELLEMENLSPQMGKIRIYILTRTSVRSSEFQGWEEESRPIESEMTPSPVGGRGVQAED